jgi:Zn-dependent protease with chaperone function
VNNRLSQWVRRCKITIAAISVVEVCFTMWLIATVFQIAQILPDARFAYWSAILTLPIAFLNYRRKFNLKYGRIIQERAVQPEVARQLEKVKQIVGELCHKRSLPAPQILICSVSDKRKLGIRLPVEMAIFSVPSLLKVLYINQEYLSSVGSESEIRAIIAHELRHEVDYMRFWLVALPWCLSGGIFFVTVMLLIWQAITEKIGIGVYRFDWPGVFQFLAWHFRSVILCLIPLFLLSRWRSRWEEYKADALACWDVGEHSGTVEGLNASIRSQLINPTALGRLLSVVLGTHPSHQARVEILNWIFGDRRQ